MGISDQVNTQPWNNFIIRMHRCSILAKSAVKVFTVVSFFKSKNKSPATFFISTEYAMTTITINTCRMKTRLDGFSAPGYQIFDFKPSIFYSKNEEF